MIASIAHTIGSVFQPIFRLFGWLLAFFYGLVPNYAVAIILLTIVIMGVLTPFTIKSHALDDRMQKLQPEIKKLQQKYKGPENRQLLNEELMRLYREKGVNPLGGLPAAASSDALPLHPLQRHQGLELRQRQGRARRPATSRRRPRCTTTLVHSGGQVRAFGMDLSLKPFSQRPRRVGRRDPLLRPVRGRAVGLQYFQMAQINNRNRKKGQPMPSQAEAIQRIMPILFAYIYFIIPAAVVLYMIISTVIRIITQYFMFRAGLMDADKVSAKQLPKTRETEREIPAPGDDAGGRHPGHRGPRKPAPRPAGPTKRPATPKPSTPRNAAAQSRSRAKRKRKAR